MIVYHLTPYENWAKIKESGALLPQGDSPVQFGLESRRSMIEFPHFAARNQSGYVELTLDIPARLLKNMPEFAPKVSTKPVPLKYVIKKEYVDEYRPKVVAARRLDDAYLMLIKHPSRNYYLLKIWDDGYYKMKLPPGSKKSGMKILDEAGGKIIEAKWPYDFPVDVEI